MYHGSHEILQRISNLHVFSRGDRRAPHKPLLLLVALGALVEGRSRLSFGEVSERLTPLLLNFAPPVQGRVQPELPYWYLANDDLWEVDGASEMPLTTARFPVMAALRNSSGALKPDVSTYFRDHPDSIPVAVQMILEEHFPPSLHGDILSAVGLQLPDVSVIRDATGAGSTELRVRDPKFRADVLRAYEFCCAATGFRVALGGSYFGCEAAHVRWHACDGPDAVENGMALEPTLHKLFDAGAWSLTDERRIIVSRELTGSEFAIEKLRALHGSRLREPLPGEPPVAIPYIRWHREKHLGGVFRQPALPL